jgi:hypothetical protein
LGSALRPGKSRPIFADIAAQRLWGKGTATQRAVDVLEGTFAPQRAFTRIGQAQVGPVHSPRGEVVLGRPGAGEGRAGAAGRILPLYIGLTRESAKRIMWKDVLKAINRRHKLGIRFNESELSARLRNISPSRSAPWRTAWTSSTTTNWSR